MVEAGSETTSSASNIAIKYLARYPEVQARANEELSRVIGDYRSPAFEDETDLPYMRAIVKEILRVMPTTNIGTPHYTTEDVVYGDFFIPKGSVVSISQYTLHFDPSRYEDADAFKPKRYLNHTLKAGAYSGHPDPYARDHFDFGAGRRICPDMHLAENSLYITLAKIIWAFEKIHPPLDDSGHEQDVDVSNEAYEEGANTLRQPYRIRFVPRNALREAVLQQEWKEAKANGCLLGGIKVDVERGGESLSLCTIWKVTACSA